MFQWQLVCSHSWETWGQSNANEQPQVCPVELRYHLKFGSLPTQGLCQLLTFPCWVERAAWSLRRGTALEAGRKCEMQTKRYKGMFSRAEKQQSQQDRRGHWLQTEDRKCLPTPLEDACYSQSGWCPAGPGIRHSRGTRGPYCLQSGPAVHRANTNIQRDIRWGCREGNKVTASGVLTSIWNLEDPKAFTGLRALLESSAAAMSLAEAPLEQAWGAAPVFTFVLMLFSLGAEVELPSWMSIWPGMVYLWIWG